MAVGDDVLVRTRRGWHAVAEWVLAPARQAAEGRIGLRAWPGGFGTPDGRLRVEGASLVVDGVAHALTTLGAAAAVAGVPPGRDSGTYDPVTAWRPDAPLAVDAGAAATLAAWFDLGTAALGRLTAELDDAAPITLWPEHFDVATTAGEVNYGASPGDDDHPRPYLYVGPWLPRTGDPFWNEPWGGSIGDAHVAGVDDALAFFRRGRALA